MFRNVFKFLHVFFLVVTISISTNAQVWANVSASEATSNIGVAHTPSPLVAGAKVRTPAPIEVLAVFNALGQTVNLNSIPDHETATKQILHGNILLWIGAANEVKTNKYVKSENLKYSVSPMAIMRTDTNINNWSGLLNRTVCLTADGRYAGEMSKQFGAIEQVYPSLTDALLNVRIGSCDALVHDESFLLELLKFPEWKKFSAQLKPYKKIWLSSIVANNNSEQAAIIKKLLKATSKRNLDLLTADQAREIAFEVYLDQTVPDCH